MGWLTILDDILGMKITQYFMLLLIVLLTVGGIYLKATKRTIQNYT